MPSDESTAYRVTQYAYPDPGKPPRNIGVVDLASLVTHHPYANRNGRFKDGVPHDVEHGHNRSYALIGGELQEVQAERTDRKYRSLGPDQVLLIKDFILDGPRVGDSRRVDVPAPVAGIIGRVDPPNGVVDIVDPADQLLIARVRHLGPIAVQAGDHVAYGQALGTQNNIGLPRSAGKHVHIEMDTRFYRQFDGYVRDLVEGRLPVEAAHRAGVEPRVVADDGVLRVGESGERIRMVQRALVAGGYRAVGGLPIEADGVYRLSMQGAVLAFQVDHGLDPTADIDAATWRKSLDVALGRPVLPALPFDGGGQGKPPTGGFRLLEQIRGHVGTLDALGATAPAVDGERLALALAGQAAAHGLTSVDHVLLAPAQGGRGEPSRMFIIQGALDDPAQRRASMSLDEAHAVPPRESLRALQAAERIADPGFAARGLAAPAVPTPTSHGI